MKPNRSIKVLIVDDSPLVRSIFSRVLEGESDIEVVGGARDPFEARELIVATRPNVILLDLEMPRMDGLTFLKKLMTHYPVPVIICSGVTSSNSKIALEAIESGAVEVVAKPAAGGTGAMRRLGLELADKIRAAAIAAPPPPAIPTSASKPASFRAAGLDPNRYLVVIGASTGGTEAIKNLLSHVPPDFPPVVMVQHMPEGFTNSFAQRLDQFSPLAVSQAVDGDVLVSGKAFLARGGTQMGVRVGGGSWRIAYGTGELVNRHCPAVDVLFDAVAQHVGRRAIGILLTGMGADGAKGLLAMRQAGAITIAQNEESCVVYGMPKVAIEMGAAQHTGAPNAIPRLVLQAIRQHKRTRTASAAK